MGWVELIAATPRDSSPISAPVSPVSRPVRQDWAAIPHPYTADKGPIKWREWRAVSKSRFQSTLDCFSHGFPDDERIKTHLDTNPHFTLSKRENFIALPIQGGMRHCSTLTNQGNGTLHVGRGDSEVDRNLIRLD